MVMGLEDWPNSDYREITEERLLASVRSTLRGQVNALRSPPIVPDTDRLGAIGLATKEAIYPTHGPRR